jgi:hypothetical protein
MAGIDEETDLLPKARGRSRDIDSLVLRETDELKRRRSKS